ncbi:eclosion hormone isoform X1 [Pogonomyrmex barbatus]|uniref:Eclosion hormone isoform X1 n=1 Tax=Pogonomyrmex barbatus TaxID=144034 RepID=A0A6I9WIZ7_9HYME|nr:eclosion hormone isoform X1 [Pogonomyrmex barbatus]
MLNSSNRMIVLLVMIFVVLCLTTSVTDAERNIVCTNRLCTGVCLRNCAQCEKMYDKYFMGQKCADFCVKYKGKLIPDCEDEISIRPFLQTPENDY